jgi:hypothetical protein
MDTSSIAKPASVHRQAWLAFGLALAALALAWYGSLYAEKHIAGSPLREARGPANVLAEPGWSVDRGLDRAEQSLFGGVLDQKVLSWTERSNRARYSFQLIAFVLPFVLGLVAANLGGGAMSAIEHAGASRTGHFQAVFAILMGGFACVIAGCMIVSVFLWPLAPSLYTS